MLLSSNSSSSGKEAEFANVEKMIDTGGRDYVGGGDVLDYLFGEDPWNWRYMDGKMIDTIRSLGVIKLAIFVIIIGLVIFFICQLWGVKSSFKNKAARSEIRNFNAIRKHDKRITRARKWIGISEKAVKKLGLGVSSTQKEYMEYNLKRANIYVPGGKSVMTPDQFNAIIKVGTFLTACLSVLIIIFINSTSGALLMLLGISLWSVLPNMIIRNIVSSKDSMIKANFFDFYSEIHYALKSNTKEPLVKRIRAYGEMEASSKPEMSEFALNCADMFDTYTESTGAARIAKDYREIPDVTKLMRLIQQFNSGADIQQDLDGFRSKLMLEREMAIDATIEKRKALAMRVMLILMILFAQAIMSAVAIYIPDLGNITSFM